MNENTYQDLCADEARGGVAAAIVAGVEIAGPQPLNDQVGRFFTQLVPAGARVEHIDLEALEEKLAPHPRRKTGTVHVQDANSFIAYLEKHTLPSTEVYADGARRQLVGVVNAHEESDDGNEQKAGHGDHRVSLELIQTPEWKAWMSLDKKFVTQQAFAEHLEDNADDVVNPDAATMLEVASSLIATTGVDFKSAVRLSTGQVQVRYEETTAARAGEGGDLEIPQAFTVAVSPFVGSDLVELTARFRYRINNGNLTLSYALVRPDLVAHRAFLDYVEIVADSIDAPLYKGRPE